MITYELPEQTNVNVGDHIDGVGTVLDPDDIGGAVEDLDKERLKQFIAADSMKLIERINQDRIEGMLWKFARPQEPTYEDTEERLKELGVKRGKRGYDYVYLISDYDQFDALRQHIRVGHAHGNWVSDSSSPKGYRKEVYRYPNVSGFYSGKGWYGTRSIEVPRYDGHEVQLYDYEIVLVLPVVEECEW